MTHELIVVQPFGPYPVGALVSDPAEVAAVLGSENVARIVRVVTPARHATPQGGETR